MVVRASLRRTRKLPVTVQIALSEPWKSFNVVMYRSARQFGSDFSHKPKTNVGALQESGPIPRPLLTTLAHQNPSSLSHARSRPAPAARIHAVVHRAAQH